MNEKMKNMEFLIYLILGEIIHMEERQTERGETASERRRRADEGTLG